MADLLSGGTIVLLNLPPESLVGLNLLSFTPGPNFRGVKELHDGFHFLYASADQSFSLRQGLWFRVQNSNLPQQKLFLAQWQPQSEQIVPLEDAAQRQQSSTYMDSVWTEGLLSYHMQTEIPSKSDWPLLTAHISAELLTRILRRSASSEWAWSLTSASSALEDVDDIPGISPSDFASSEERELHFLPIDLRQTWREGATGRERTDAARDRSWAFTELIQKNCYRQDEWEVLGELQFTYVMVLTLSNFSCLEQWKRILGLFFTCKSLVEERPTLFQSFLSTLRLQLEHSRDVEGGLLDLTEDTSGLLKKLLRGFRKSIEDSNRQPGAVVLEELGRLEEFLQSEYGWQMDDSFVKKGLLELEDGEQVEMEVNGYEEDDETGEYAPMVVELTTSQVQELFGKNEQTTEITRSENV